MLPTIDSRMWTFFPPAANWLYYPFVSHPDGLWLMKMSMNASAAIISVNTLRNASIHLAVSRVFAVRDSPWMLPFALVRIGSLAGELLAGFCRCAFLFFLRWVPKKCWDPWQLYLHKQKIPDVNCLTLIGRLHGKLIAFLTTWSDCWAVGIRSSNCLHSKVAFFVCAWERRNQTFQVVVILFNTTLMLN